jgi:hypothetical protein
MGASSAPIGAPPAAAPTTATTSAPSSTLPPVTPQLVLNGESTIRVEGNRQYTPCFGAMTSNCELGATATLEKTGDLNGRIRACEDQVGKQYTQRLYNGGQQA